MRRSKRPEYDLYAFRVNPSERESLDKRVEHLLQVLNKQIKPKGEFKVTKSEVLLTAIEAGLKRVSLERIRELRKKSS